MNRRSLFVFMSLLVVLSMLLAACGGGAEPTAAPVDTAATDAANAAAAAADTAATEAAAAAAEVDTAATEAAAAAESAAAEVDTAATEAADAAATAEAEAAAAAEGDMAAEPTEEPFVSTCEAGSPSLLIWADDQRSASLIELKDQVLAETGVCLDVQEIPFGDIRTKISLAGPAGEGPDIFVGAHDWLGELYANGVVAPIDLGAKASDFDPVAVQAFTYEGELYGMPNAVENVAFICNPDLIDAAPASYDDVRSMSEAAAEAGELTQFFAQLREDAYHQEPIQTAFGGYIFGQNDDGTYDACDVGLDSEGAVAYLTWVDQMVKDGLLSGDVDWETAHVLFETGDAACIITGPWALDRFNTAGVNYDFYPFPSQPGHEASPFVGVQGFMINSFSDNKVLAQTFLTDYVATEPVMEAFYESGNRPPAYLPARGAMDEDAQAFAEAGANAHPMPAIPAMNAVWDAWGNAVKTVFLQSATPEQAAADAAATVREAAACE
ncbi:MAG: maltose ABC transporter substrate-binding protein [Caldilineae bacterium]|nr:maltose ABC transporter substrate-binding protein [Anaerolineae bacterium]MCB0203600.1 maltose ABC transporter substrate-binding protein [Anaerolineae bacterium]MCB9152817.1 maltose ABC transporter substrate-binding protein [Caldilineae bacterium]